MKNTLNSWYTSQIMEQLEGVKLQSYLWHFETSWWLNKFSFHQSQSVIINNKHCIYQLPHELANDLRLRILGD